MRFEYLEPVSIEEAIKLLEQYGERAKVMAAGTDLLVQTRKRQIRPEYVIYIGRIPGLDYIRYDNTNGLKSGALTTIRSLEKSVELQRNYPIISQAASQLASVAVRNMATLGGNLCNAAPSADMAPALIGLSARARIVGPKGERIVSLEDFFTGPGKSIMGNDELLVEIQAPVPQPRTGGVYLKHGMRGKTDLAIIGVAVVITLEPGVRICKDAKIVLGEAGPKPMRAYQAEEILKGKEIDEAVIEKSAQAASDESQPITGRAPAAYRREMVKVFTRRAITQALNEIAMN